MINCSVGFPVVFKDGKIQKILLGKNLRSFIDIGVGLWSGFGGKVEIGESSHQCLVREVQEECCIIPTNYEKIGTLKWLWRDVDICHFAEVYLIYEWKGNPSNSSEMIPCWFDVKNIPFNSMWNCSAIYFPALLSEKKFDGIMFYSRKIGNLVLETHFNVIGI